MPVCAADTPTANTSSHHSTARSLSLPTPPSERFCGISSGRFSPRPFSPSRGAPAPRHPWRARYWPVSRGMTGAAATAAVPSWWTLSGKKMGQNFEPTPRGRHHPQFIHVLHTEPRGSSMWCLTARRAAHPLTPRTLHNAVPIWPVHRQPLAQKPQQPAAAARLARPCAARGFLNLTGILGDGGSQPPSRKQFTESVVLPYVLRAALPMLTGQVLCGRTLRDCRGRGPVPRVSAVLCGLARARHCAAALTAQGGGRSNVHCRRRAHYWICGDSRELRERGALPRRRVGQGMCIKTPLCLRTC